MDQSDLYKNTWADSHIKMIGVIVVPFRGLKFVDWYRLGY